MKPLTTEQAFVATCWSKVLFMDYETFWKMAQDCLGETIINHEFANPELWQRLKEKTMDDFKTLVGSQRIEGGSRMTKAEEILIDIKFSLDMYSAGADGAENALEKVREILKPVVSLNENQKLLLEDLREIKESQKDKNMLGLIWVLGQRFTTKSNIKAFTDQEILEVLQALEQEEE